MLLQSNSKNIQSAVALGLSIRGIDVLTAQEAGLRGASDLEHLTFATADGRVLVTYDTDFLVIDASGQVILCLRPRPNLILFCPH